MQKISPMHLNTTPTSFEGSGTEKHHKKHETLKKLKTYPEKTARAMHTLYNSRGRHRHLHSVKRAAGGTHARAAPSADTVQLSL